ncbi:glycosyltransferase family 2 protein [Dellaglioa carnosa]|uniref:glycosyltransferase family 2 protein n=1 Tax=Dellaglioa carnosa TaxID=2995136 RepID=UPI0022A8980E|nr:glycosyltransferase [Dellaglioa carnosa]MCZ2492139.1 glycosyltransferase [Dellaglioa carnosa]
MNNKRNSNPLFSIIVPVFNVERYLQKCIDSILENKMNKEYEIILVDDGSTDGSGIICDRYADLNENVIVYHKSNGGLSDSRNYGIEKANGEFLFFIDSDDWIRTDALAKLEKICENKDVDMICFNFSAVNEFEENVENDLGFKKRILEDGFVNGEKALEELFKGNIKSYAVTNLYKKKLFTTNKVRFPVGRNYEDVGTTYKLFFYSKKVFLLNDKLYFYLQRQGSISHINKISDINSIQRNASETDDFFEQKNNLKYFMYLLRAYQVQKLFTGYRIAVNVDNPTARILEVQIRKEILSKARNVRVINLLNRKQNTKIILLYFNLLKLFLRKKWRN